MDSTEFLDEVYERDVRVFSARFSLNRTALRMLMHYPIVRDKIHSLDYEVSAEVFLDALKPVYDYAYSGGREIPRRALLHIMNRLKRIIAEKQ